MDTISFNTFNTSGVSEADTFETWRQKTNGIVELVNNINLEYASKSGVLLLEGQNQTVLYNANFQNGISVGGVAPITTNVSNEIVFTNNILVDNDKNVNAYSLESRSGVLRLNDISYQWPTEPENGYIYTSDGNIIIKGTSDVVDAVLNAVTSLSRVSAEEIHPVGSIIGIPFADSIDAVNTLNGVWLKCDGSTYSQNDYGDLYDVLGTNTLPNLENSILSGTGTSVDYVEGSATTPNPSLVEVYYYIKAVKDNVVIFSITSGNGISLLSNQENQTSIDIYGGSISLKVGSEFDFALDGSLIIKTAAISHTKLQNATTTVSSGSVSIALRDSNGYIRGNTPGVSNPSGDGSILVNKAYADSLSGSKDHKVRKLNGRGFNSYSAHPSAGCVYLTYDNRSKVYGINDVFRGYRFGLNGIFTNSRGYTLPPYDAPIKDVYTDTLNTYILTEDGLVYSYGYNTTGKAGVPGNAGALTGPHLAFNGIRMSHIILSYDNNSQTVYGLTTNGKLYASGSNLNGQLGIGTSAISGNTVASIVGNSDKTISKAWLIGGGGTETGYALADDGTLWACGYGAHGQIGRSPSNTSWNKHNTNTRWVPVLNPNATAYSLNTTASYTNGVYTAQGHGLLNYDVLEITNNNVKTYCVVKYIDENTFELKTSDSLAANTPQQVVNSTTSMVYSRFSGIADAYFGGRAGNTFAYLKANDATLYSWGYNAQGQLGHGDIVSLSIPKQVASTTAPGTKAHSVYTGLDNTVHYITTGGLLYAVGDNTFGLLGIGITTNQKAAFTQITVSNLSASRLTITNNTYKVYRESEEKPYKFFSSGTNSRFCVFESGDGVNKKTVLTAWGNNNYNKLGCDNNAASYNTPQHVYITGERNIADIQTTDLFLNNDVSTILIYDENQGYGAVHTCGFHSHNIGGFPDASYVPFFTEDKSI